MNQKTEAQPQNLPAQQAARPPAIAPARLPYHPAIQQRFGYDASAWRALVDAVYPLAKEAESVILALSYCKARGLDPFKRPVHIVPMWNSALKRMVETVWPGIGELRTTAFRTGQYAGRDEAKYGPTITEKVGTLEMSYPEWCQVTVFRLLGGQRHPFPGPRVYWRESYAPAGRDSLNPNAMWQRRPFGQLDKCAEAAALRAAFPEEIGNEYTSDEMEGKVIGSGSIQPINGPRPNLTGALDRLAAPAPRGQAAIEHEARETITEDGEIVKTVDADEDQPPVAEPAQEPSAPPHADEGAGDEDVSSKPAADPPPETTKPEPAKIDPLAMARERGRKARADGLARRALPGEYRQEGREAERDEWEGGWDEAGERGDG